eukprot:382100_1
MFSKTPRIFSRQLPSQRVPIRLYSQSNISYARSLQTIHWLSAGVILTCFGCVEIAKRTPKDKPLKGTLMKYHKSFGLTLTLLIATRIGLRATTKIPKALPMPSWQKIASTSTHHAMYAFMIFMPVTGITMGYFGGKGIPFFAWKIPGKEQPNKQIGKAAYDYHKIAGTMFECLVALHVSAVAFHTVKGDKIFSRMNPMASTGLFATKYYHDLYIDDEDDESLLA